ncbi:MAG: hypothetical protein BZ151_10360 [Desulfobacca sp. 4484_104]|nr:MAG: hypothetical protein BZ151_10360 [Desulfobacca sp. 4484_104]
MRKLIRIFLALSLVALMAGPALANLAVDFSSVTQNFTNYNWSLGWEFTTKAPVTVAALGFYDDLKNGLTQNHDVGIYDAVGNLLVSTTVLPTDPLTSWFRFHSITPYTLAAGQTYYIQAVTGSENYTWYTNGLVVDPSITYNTDAYYIPANGVLTFPNASDGHTQALGGGYFGPNFTTSAVPLPSALLLVGSGFLGLVGWRRFNHQS